MDAVGNLCDNCASNANPDQTDTDMDTTGDECDTDDDNDTILDNGGGGTIGDNPCTGGVTVSCDDNCIQVANANQTDGDMDGVGNVCDNCLGVSNANQVDSDLDTLGDACDNCDLVPNLTQEDLDADLEGDACDADEHGVLSRRTCPRHPDKGLSRWRNVGTSSGWAGFPRSRKPR